MEDFPVSCLKYQETPIIQQAEIKKSGCEKIVHFVLHSRMKRLLQQSYIYMYDVYIYNFIVYIL